MSENGIKSEARRDGNLGTNKYLTIAIEKKEFVQLALAQPNTKR